MCKHSLKSSSIKYSKYSKYECSSHIKKTNTQKNDKKHSTESKKNVYTYIFLNFLDI